MIDRGRAMMALMLLAGCGDGPAERNDTARARLETAAITRGLVRDPDTDHPAGLYARDTDRLCVVQEGSTTRIGVHVDYGDGIACSAHGTLAREAGGWRADLGDDCRFAVTVEPDRIAFPAILPNACRRRCTSRASLASLGVERLSASAAEARAMRDGRGRFLCGGAS
ncbi:hypothetical protein [Sphingomonas sp.]